MKSKTPAPSRRRTMPTMTTTRAPPTTAAFAALRAELTDDNERSAPVDASSFALPKVQFRVRGVAGDCCTPGLPWGRLDVHAFPRPRPRRERRRYRGPLTCPRRSHRHAQGCRTSERSAPRRRTRSHRLRADGAIVSRASTPHRADRRGRIVARRARRGDERCRPVGAAAVRPQ